MFELDEPRSGEPFSDQYYRLQASLQGEDPEAALEMMKLAAGMIPDAVMGGEAAIRKNRQPVLTIEDGELTVTSPLVDEGWNLYVLSETGDTVEWGPQATAEWVHVIMFEPGESVIYTEEFIPRIVERGDSTVWSFRRSG